MEQHYDEKKVRLIAGECREFEHVINAMGYGYSMLNVSEENFARRCPDCVHWLGGSCRIFHGELAEWHGNST